MNKFIKSLKYEFKKISWTTKKDLLRDLPFFIITLIILTLAILAFDSLFNFIVLKIISFF